MPYTQGLCKSIKNICKQYDMQTGTEVAGWNVMKCTLRTQPEPLVKGSRST